MKATIVQFVKGPSKNGKVLKDITRNDMERLQNILVAIAHLSPKEKLILEDTQKEFMETVRC